MAGQSAKMVPVLRGEISNNKKKGMVLYSAVSSPLDRSKRFTLSSPGRPVHSDTVLGFSLKHFHEYTKPPVERASAYFYTTIGAASSKFDEFLANRSQFDIDHDQIWQAYADRSGNGSYLKKKWPNEWPGRVGSLWPSFEARLQAASWHLTFSIYTAKL